MRKIPVNINGHMDHIVGFLEIDETAISDEMLSDMHVSWHYIPDQKKIVAVALVPMQSVPRRD